MRSILIALTLAAPAAPSADVIRPSADPVKLVDANRPLSATYTYQGERRTLDDFLTRTKTNGFLVLRGQKIVHERYTDANRNTRFQSWSMAKSFTSAALGVALREGHIRSLDEPVTKYLPELRKSGYNNVSIRHLLWMSSGTDWDEREDVPRMQIAANQGQSLTRMAARQQPDWTPGSQFEYNSMNSYVLARVITEATGTPYHRYVEKKIWQPAGMAGAAQISSDGKGESLGYCCFQATDRDYARFGLLYLRQGKAHGKQVVPASWVKSSTSPSGVNPKYGLHWWLGGERDFMAAGFGGQYIYVSPEHDVVIVKSTTSTGAHDQEEVLAAFRAVAAKVS
ncbi:serine hydrolase [Nonomuraea sp. C10]|uniref:serine hydrolase domain-containing protein n=1 Tax=Nonomuraea sp. C10 TaxID=2600577 RepID=UPI0021C49BBE|nr:serine hydrolase domain-containing protein [Nonomuraea sp. C10]